MGNEKLAPLLKCDVDDHDLLAIYRLYRNKWVEMLGGKDGYSIFNQISMLFYHDSFYRTVNECRRHHIKASYSINSSLNDLINEGFVAIQALSIRRITDPNFSGKEKAIISLRRIIDEIDDNLFIITRENYICYNGAKYDGSGSTYLDGLSRPMHEVFDRLSGVSPQNRSRSDIIQKTIVKRVKSKLAECDNIRAFANKYLAHASDPSNRGEITGISLAEFDKAYEAVATVCNFISTQLLFGSHYHFIVSCMDDPLDNLEVAMCQARMKRSLSEFLDARNKKLGEYGGKMKVMYGKNSPDDEVF